MSIGKAGFLIAYYNMKQFTETHFFLLIKENNNNPSSLEDEYEKFACHLLAEGIACTNKGMYYNALVYTHVELTNLTGVSGKKCLNLS
jgi:hypothetical protein